MRADPADVSPMKYYSVKIGLSVLFHSKVNLYPFNAAGLRKAGKVAKECGGSVVVVKVSATIQ